MNTVKSIRFDHIIAGVLGLGAICFCVSFILSFILPATDFVLDSTLWEQYKSTIMTIGIFGFSFIITSVAASVVFYPYQPVSREDDHVE